VKKYQGAKYVRDGALLLLGFRGFFLIGLTEMGDVIREGSSHPRRQNKKRKRGKCVPPVFWGFWRGKRGWVTPQTPNLGTSGGTGCSAGRGRTGGGRKGSVYPMGEEGKRRRADWNEFLIVHTCEKQTGLQPKSEEGGLELFRGMSVREGWKCDVAIFNTVPLGVRLEG